MNRGRGANGVEPDGRLSRLCDLPNDVLHSILGLLPIIEVVRTCVLAKRWEHLWRSIPCLIFKRDYYDNVQLDFYNFIDRVCALRDPYYPIQKFVFDYDQLSLDDDDSRFDALIMVAIKGQVQELSLKLVKWYDSYVLPHCLFSSETLVRLELSNYRWSKLRVPDSIFLPRLKVLHLRRLRIKDDKSIQKLISSCPLLEELTMYNCDCFTKPITPRSEIIIYAPNLVRLTICCHRLDLIHPLWMHCESLKEFKYVGSLEHGFHVYGQSMRLDQAILGLIDYRKEVAKHGFELLNCLSSTKRLILSQQSCKVLDSSSQILELSRFDNLTELYIYKFNSLGITAETLLGKSPSLQILSLQGRWRRTPFQSCALPDSAHLCHMKKIKLAPYRAKIDIDFVGMLLKTCLFLEEVVISIHRSGVNDGALEKVRGLEKVSQDCRIYIEYREVVINE